MTSPTERTNHKDLQFGVIFFSSNETPSNANLYRLVIETARFADENGFSSVWIPERHFTKDGWLFPNPSVLHAALARETKRIYLRAGSVVVPLHHPIRIVEEWAMVDNLSGGRVGLSFASGWHPNDFVFSPEKYANRREEMYRNIAIIQKLWEREPIILPNGNGKRVEVEAYPHPIQRKLPTWLTAAGNPSTFVKAGEMGANVLTHMFNQNMEELGEKICSYRDALAQHGHDPSVGQVTLMLHTFVTDNPASIDGHARAAYCRYLKSASYLLDAIASSRGQKVDLGQLSDHDVEEYLQFVFDRLVSDRRVLFGSPETCFPLIAELRALGVDEIACQLDFGIETEVVLASLPHLCRLKELCGDARLGRLPSMSTTAGKIHGPRQVAPEFGRASEPATQLLEIRARCPEEVSRVEFYKRLREREVHFGAQFQGIQRLWRRSGEALAHIRLPEELEWKPGVYNVHPAFLDACLQVLYAALPDAIKDVEKVLYLPVGVRAFRLHSQPGSEVWSHAVLRSTDGLIEGDVRLLDMNGTVVAEARGLQLRQTDRAIPRPSRAEMDDLYYELVWQVAEEADPACAPNAPPPNEQQTWLIFSDDHGVGEAIGLMLGAQGRTYALVTQGSAFEVLDARRFRIRPESPEDLERLIGSLSKPHDATIRQVIHLWSLNASSSNAATMDDLAQAQIFGCGSVLQLLQTLVQAEGGQRTRLWLVTRGAQPIAGHESDLTVLQAPLWGFGRAVACEHPDLWGGLVDLDPLASSESSARALLRTAHFANGESQLAFREEQRYVARFVRKAIATERLPPLRLRTDASYLITGGLGDLGLIVARWMVERGARHILLLGRTPLPPPSGWDEVEEGSRLAHQVAAIRELQKLGADIRVASVDVADEGQMSTFLDTIRQDGRPPIRGVVHAAAVIQGNILLKLDREALTEVMRPKSHGGWLLHRLVGAEDLDFFVLFSAIPSLLGWLGQGAANYAAANAFLDALAHYRRARGKPALSITWGPWREVGLAERTEGGLERLAALGIGSVSPQRGREALERLLTLDESHVAVVAVDWQRFLRAAPGVLEAPLLANFARETASARSPTTSALNGAEVRRELQTAPSQSERRRLLVSYACKNVARILQIPAAKLDPDQPLNKIGLDSLMAIELKNRIESDLGVRLSIATLLKGPSIHELATQFQAQLADATPSARTTAEATRGANRARLLEPEEAERLLVELDQLSDAQVDSYLHALVGKQNA